MLREPSPQQYQFETITLDELVPEDHLVRKIDATIDFEFIRDAVAHLYCPDNGRPAIDPVRLIKMMLLGYLFGIPSERRLVKEIQVNNAYRWFLRMGLTEKVPDASTLSQNRIRRFNDSDVFQQIFDHIVEQALGQGMANGRVLYTDSTHLKANASPRKAVNEQRPEGVSEYLEQLNAAVEADRKQHEKKPLPGVKKTPGSAVAAVKNTKVSTTDPESGFMHREGKPKGFFWLDHRTVDGKHGIIMDTHVTPGSVHDSQPFIGRLKRQTERFGLETVAAGVDAGYFTAAVCHLTQEMGIALVPGYRRPNKGQNEYQKKQFTYDPEKDMYVCPAGAALRYGTTDRNGYRHYRSDKAVCAVCPERGKCTKSRQMQKTITRHVWEEAKEKANALRLTKWGKKVYARRKETVERSFADAKQHHGHRYARFRGLLKVQMQCLLAATAQNLKKMALLALFCRLIIALKGLSERFRTSSGQKSMMMG
ncbi:IS1182 family transposase [Salmonella enterica]|nr:IS1182 family transposase [Salmonella enterica]ECT8235505.1 IS1182 family transposase [Salmonella enterica subsp. enterica serovar Virchow]EDC7504848.1 IS1182 family transposase [Salmonella enterica subsp. enterica serovar Virchow]EDC7584642.1 IS1182 family transposase [Salmonella enterica subsp. enterica serovar Virchow]EDD6050636.1 IS1182 family transposase [Salmonella enterica]